MRRCLALLPLAVVLAVPSPAHGGGWATTGIDSLPRDLRAGEPWRVRIEVRRHGVTPMTGLHPRVRIAGDGGVRRDFPARATGRPGVYVADVRFPTGGHWHYRILDGFTDAWPHTFPAITVRPAAGAGGGSGLPWPQAIAIAAVVLLWVGGWLYGAWPPSLLRRRRPAPLRPVVPG